MTKSVWPVRLALALAVTVYLVYSSFGIAHPCLWGHMGHHEAEYMMRVRTTFRQHMITPATHAGFDAPTWHEYYLHHPIGYHHLLGLFTLIVGDHIWTPTLFPALTGLLTMLALFVLVKRWWSREWAAVAVATWVGLPIIWSFSILTDAMFPAMACSIYFCHVYLEFTEKPSKTWLKRALWTQLLFGLLFWEAYFQALFHGIQMIVWGRTRRGRAEKIGRWPAWLVWFLATGTMASSTMAFHLIFVWKKGMWDDFMISFHQRHTASLQFIIARHKEWLHILYGWPLVGIGLFWLALFVVRCLFGRARKRDQAVLIFFAINVIYIILFAEGSSLHLYRVFWFSSFLTLAVTDLACDLYGLVSRAMPARPDVALAAAAAALLVYFGIETPHSLHNLLESRVMMGTHGEPHYHSDYPKQLFAMEAARRTGRNDFVLIHRNLPHRVEFWYYVDRNNRPIATLAELPLFLKLHPHPVILMDGYVPPSEKREAWKLLKKHPGALYDRYLLIDTRSDHPDFREYRFQPEKPSWEWWWFVSHRYPPMKPVPTSTIYSACVYSGIQVKPPADLADPPKPPLTNEDQAICWHNFEVLRGKTEVADAFAAALTARGKPLGVDLPFARVIGLGSPSRHGVEVWMKTTSAPPARPLRWTLTPQNGKPITAYATGIGEQTLAESPPGDLYGERLAFSVGPGRYRLSLELGPPYATVDLGELDLK